MKDTRMIMGMPITIEILDAGVMKHDLADIFKYFVYIDETFSTYKSSSEISCINRGDISTHQYSKDMQEVLRLSEETKKLTGGYFDISHNNKLDPSGLVKGWAIYRACKLARRKGFKSFYIDAGGDIQAEGKVWKVGIKNPFQHDQVIKTIALRDRGIATSGTYNRGEHIYNPHTGDNHIPEIVSLTVIGPNIYEADRFATAAFAMGRHGIAFIEHLSGFEGYMIDSHGIATVTSLFDTYVHHA